MRSTQCGGTVPEWKIPVKLEAEQVLRGQRGFPLAVRRTSTKQQKVRPCETLPVPLEINKRCVWRPHKDPVDVAFMCFYLFWPAQDMSLWSCDTHL